MWPFKKRISAPPNPVNVISGITLPLPDDPRWSMYTKKSKGGITTPVDRQWMIFDEPNQGHALYFAASSNNGPSGVMVADLPLESDELFNGVSKTRAYMAQVEHAYMRRKLKNITPLPELVQDIMQIAKDYESEQPLCPTCERMRATVGGFLLTQEDEKR
jgi:hypothetical protein